MVELGEHCVGEDVGAPSHVRQRHLLGGRPLALPLLLFGQLLQVERVGQVVGDALVDVELVVQGLPVDLGLLLVQLAYHDVRRADALDVWERTEFMRALPLTGTSEANTIPIKLIFD